MDTELIEMIKKDEGLMLFPYVDSVGKLTIGYGRNLEDKGIRQDEAEHMLINDIEEAEAELERVFPIAKTLSTNRYRALVNMIFNLGTVKFLQFKKMRHAIEQGDFERAADEMLDSLWARQVKGRAERLAKMMREG